LLGGLGGFQNGFAERGYPARFRAPFVQFPDRSDSRLLSCDENDRPQVAVRHPPRVVAFVLTSPPAW
jgi:hypothetical protein